jgi:ribosome-binding factor A
MKSRRDLKGLDALCGEVHADDGIDPREGSSRSEPQGRRSRKSNRKDLQLAKQVFRAIDAVLRGELTDPVLQDLEVVSVQPAPDATHFLVILRPTKLDDRVSVSSVLERLERVHRFLRHQVAAAITRKRAPELSFQVIGGEGEYP